MQYAIIKSLKLISIYSIKGELHMTTQSVTEHKIVHQTQTFKNWLIENNWKLISIIFIYQMAILSIGIVNFPYIDDVSRQIHGDTSFAWSYSRWGSELASWAVQGSRHLTDMGLTTHILTGLILATSSILAVYILNNKKMDWVPLISSSLIGLNPWFLECISFRFDSPYMALSILFSIFPFLWWKGNKKYFFFLSVIGVFLMCNTYQASSGVYIVMALALFYRDTLTNVPFGQLFKKLFLAGVAFVIAMGAYAIEMKFNPALAERGGIFSTSNIIDLPVTFVKNIYIYGSTIYHQSASIWILFYLIFIILFTVSSIVRSETSILKSFTFALLYLGIAFIFSYGVFLIFTEPLATARPRYMHGFGAFLGISLILMTAKSKNKPINFITKLMALLFMYYMLSFPFTYASMLSYQKDSFERQSTILTTDLKNIVNDDRKNVLVNALFKDSPVVLNSQSNYPILGSLVPSNSAPYWPNFVLFNTYSNLNVNIEPFDFSDFKKTDKKLEITNAYYDIYTKGNKIFVFMK